MAIKSYKTSDHTKDAAEITLLWDTQGTFCFDIDAKWTYLRLAALGAKDLRASIVAIDLFTTTVSPADCLRELPRASLMRDTTRPATDKDGWTFPCVVAMRAAADLDSHVAGLIDQPIYGLGEHTERECNYAIDGCLVFASEGIKSLRFDYRL